MCPSHDTACALCVRSGFRSHGNDVNNNDLRIVCRHNRQIDQLLVPFDESIAVPNALLRHHHAPLISSSAACFLPTWLIIITAHSTTQLELAFSAVGFGVYCASSKFLVHANCDSSSSKTRHFVVIPSLMRCHAVSFYQMSLHSTIFSQIQLHVTCLRD